MSRSIDDRRAASLLRECPKCGASVGVPCTGKKGPRIAQHQARYSGLSVRVLEEIKAAQKRVRRGKIGGFYATPEWRAVRYQALVANGGTCQCCGARASFGKPLHVDHIKPRSKHPDLALELSNLQVLCDDCNIGKGAADQTDWRPASGRIL